MAEASNAPPVPDSSAPKSSTKARMESADDTKSVKSKNMALEEHEELIAKVQDKNAKQFYKFMGPQLDELEKNLSKQMQVFDDLTKTWEDEREVKRKRQAQRHVPQLLKNRGQSTKELSKRIEGLFMHTNFAEQYKEPKQATDGDEMMQGFDELVGQMQKIKPDDNLDDISFKSPEPKEFSDDEFDDEELIKTELPLITDIDKQILFAHSLSAYATRLPKEHREILYKRIHNDTSHWIREIFRVKDSVAMFHDEAEAGLVNICRIALAEKYPDYLEKGFESLYTKPPVIYISAASEPSLADRLCFMLGLPTSCISTVPCKAPEPGQVHKMNTEAFESLVNDHSTSTREPLLLIAHASTPLLAQTDPLAKLKSICKKKGIWMHVEGLNLATLCLMSIPTNMLPGRTSDSCTLNMASWFGMTGCPSVSLYKQEALPLAAKLGMTQITRRLLCLPLWVSLQAMGVDGLTAKVQNAINMTQKMMSFLSKIGSVTILNKKPPTKTEVSGLGDMLSRMLSTILVFEVATPVVIFRYGKSKEVSAPVAPYAQTAELVDNEEEAMLMRYFDSLNVWFVETVRRECPSVYLEAIDIEGHGTAVKFSPLEHGHIAGTREEHMAEIVAVASRQLSIMDATVSHKKSFHDVVEAQDNLRYVEIPGWAGMGAVQYIPTEWLGSLSDLPDQGKHEINTINMELVHQLKSNDAAFSLGRSTEMLACARFGLITQETDMEELLGLVCATGKEIEEASKFEEQMAEIVKQGIEKANKDLEAEEENRLLQEGVLRQVPLVASFVNWWSPPSKEMSNVKGRTFNLSSGEIASTEETYRNKMQVMHEGQSHPKRQGPLKNILKHPEGHPSRQLSTSSAGNMSDSADASMSSQQHQSVTDDTSEANVSGVTPLLSVSSNTATQGASETTTNQTSPNTVDLK